MANLVFSESFTTSSDLNYLFYRYLLWHCTKCRHTFGQESNPQDPSLIHRHHGLQEGINTTAASPLCDPEHVLHSTKSAEVPKTYIQLHFLQAYKSVYQYLRTSSLLVCTSQLITTGTCKSGIYLPTLFSQEVGSVGGVQSTPASHLHHIALQTFTCRFLPNLISACFRGLLQELLKADNLVTGTL